jgi:hypothetical protein
MKINYFIIILYILWQFKKKKKTTKWKIMMPNLKDYKFYENI